MTASQTTARTQAVRRPSPSPWLLPDDGIIDELAVAIAAAGIRPVALTPAERRLAAERILARGGHAGQIATRLRMSPTAAVALAADIRQATGTPARHGQAGDAA